MTQIKEGTDRARPVPTEPGLNAEERQERGLDQSKVICPTAAVDRVLKRLGLEGRIVCPDERDKQLLCRAVEDMIERSTEFGALLAKGSGTGWYLGKDVEVYLKNNEHLHLPGYSSMAVNPAPKVSTDNTAFKHTAAVRQALQEVAPTPVDMDPPAEVPAEAAGQEP